MGEQSLASSILIYLIAFALYLVLLVGFLRFVFRVKRQLWNQKQQIDLLIRIAEKLGVPKDDKMKHVEYMNNNSSDEYLK